MTYTNLKSCILREEYFGGILYSPEQNTVIAINNNLFDVLLLIKKSKSLLEALNKLRNTYNLKHDEAKKTFEDSLFLITKALNSKDYLTNNNSPWDNVFNFNQRIKLSAPLMLIIELTSRCNQNCNFCYLGNEILNNIDFPSELLYSIIRQAKEMNVPKIQLMGGEPLCYPEFMNLLEYISNNHIYFSFTTNGLLLNNYISSLTKLKWLLPIQISMHGNRDDLIKYNISKDSYNHIVNNCLLLSKHHIPFGIKIVLTKYNYLNLFSLLKTINDIGAKTVTLLHLLPIGKGKSVFKRAAFNKQDILFIIDQINLAKNKFNSLYIDYRSFLNIYFPREPKSILDHFLNCPAGNLDLRIRYDGKIIQCSSLRKPLNDLNVLSLKNIWSSISDKVYPCPYNNSENFKCIKNY